MRIGMQERLSGQIQKAFGGGAIEFSDGPQRIIVNCGIYYGQDANWQHALAQPAALSIAHIDRKSTRLNSSH